MSFFSRVFTRRATSSPGRPWGAGSCKELMPEHCPAGASTSQWPLSSSQLGDSDDDDDGDCASPSLLRPPTNDAFFFRPTHVRKRFPTAATGGRRGALDVDAPPSLSSLSSDDPTFTSTSGTGYISKYRQIKKKCIGSKCTILEAVDGSTLIPVVVKVYCTKDRDRWEQEVLALSKASKVPHVMRSVAVGEDEDQLYTTVTASTGISLIELMSGAANCRLPEGECQDVMRQVLESISGLHAAGIIHRHMKPEHVMCSKGGILLVDLSDATLDGKSLWSSVQVGTLAYMAPEMLMMAQADVFHTVLQQGMAEEDLLVHDEKVDVWAIGVMVFELLTGRQPFIAESSGELLDMQNIQCSRPGPGGMHDFVAREHLSGGAKSFISDALQLDAAKRPSAASLLSHPWLRLDARSSSSSGTSLLFA